MNTRSSSQRQQSAKRPASGYEVRYPGISQPFVVHFDLLVDAKAHRDYLVKERQVPAEDVVVADLVAGRLVE